MHKFIKLCCIVIALCVSLEVILRFFPVHKGFCFLSVDENQKVFRASPDRTVVISEGWSMVNPQYKAVNNAGFVNPQPYKRTAESSPLVAVVGDSFIESAQVSDKETFFAILQKRFPRQRVYSFGFSGAGLSQYLIWAQYARAMYNNTFLIISVVPGDIIESLKTYKYADGFHHYNAEGALEYKPYTSRWYVPVINKSALLSYMLYNIRIQNIWASFTASLLHEKTMGAKTKNTLQDDLHKVVDLFFRDLPVYSGLHPKQILFIISGEESPYFEEKARDLGYNILNINTIFTHNYAKYKKRFTNCGDSHWNTWGHKVIADSIEATAFWRFFTQDAQ